MKSVLTLQHVESEGLGIIGPAFKKAAMEADTVRIYKNECVPARLAERYSALVVLGGPMGVYEEDVYPFIKDELKLIESALKRAVPVLGVCLGAQLLAKAAGAAVYKGNVKEIGWYDLSLTDEGAADRLFVGLPEKMTVFQWHGDTFDVPAGGVNLASSDAFPNQLIRVGANAYGLQFHLEVTSEMIKQWLAVNSDELKSAKNIDPEKILSDTPKHIGTLHRHCGTFLNRFIRLIE